jgi:hypothetical protein
MEVTLGDNSNCTRLITECDMTHGYKGGIIREVTLTDYPPLSNIWIMQRQ